MSVTTSWMATEVTQPPVKYLPKVSPSVIDVTKIRLMWRRDTHKPSVRLPGVLSQKMAYCIWCVVFRAAYMRSTVTHCCVQLASSACMLDWSVPYCVVNSLWLHHVLLGWISVPSSVSDRVDFIVFIFELPVETEPVVEIGLVCYAS